MFYRLECYDINVISKVAISSDVNIHTRVYVKNEPLMAITRRFVLLIFAFHRIIASSQFSLHIYEVVHASLPSFRVH